MKSIYRKLDVTMITGAASTVRISVLAAASGPATRTPRPSGCYHVSPQITLPRVMPGWCAQRPGAATWLVPTLPSGSRLERSV